MSNKRFILLMLIAAALMLVLLLADTNNRTPDQPTSTPPTTTELPTTTTTVDLSFLNTTTTTKPPQQKPTPVVGDFFECVRWRESRGDYTAVNSTGTFMGAYQIYQGGWDVYASRINRTDLIGVQPHKADPTDQDAVALAMYLDLGAKPWGGACQ